MLYNKYVIIIYNNLIISYMKLHNILMEEGTKTSLCFIVLLLKINPLLNSLNRLDAIFVVSLS